MANIFAMEHSVGASGDLASKARAAWRTINRDVTREVAMSASLNWMCCKTLFEMFTGFLYMCKGPDFYSIYNMLN